MSIITFSKSVKGSSHENNGKPMQDWSENFHIDEMNADVIMVSDGHGSDKHFRSDRGARFAIEAAKESIVTFMEEFSPELAEDSFVQRGIMGVKDPQNEDYTPRDAHEREFRQLFENIKFRWCEKVINDWNENPPTEEELSKANTQGRPLSLAYYSNGREIRAYGCTLMAAVRTPDFWMAFHIGDGKCIAFHEDGTWYEPIPWDSRCFLTTTTSLCHESSESFRYCYGRKSCPAIFIGSDGMDDSYMPIDKLAEFYSLVIRVITENGFEYASDQLGKMMPVISKEGSHDDISIAFWIDEESLHSLNKNILESKLKTLEDNKKEAEEKKRVAEQKKEEIVERKQQLQEETESYKNKRSEYDSQIKEAEETKKKAEEDLKDATFLYEGCQNNLNQITEKIIILEKYSSDNEREYECHLREVGLTETMFQEIEKEIRSFEEKIQEGYQEMKSITDFMLKFRL